MERARTVHTPVLFREVMEALKVSEGGKFLDCTVGGAGHLEGILAASASSEVVGFDRDARAIERAKDRLAEFEGRFHLEHQPFSHVLTAKDQGPFDGILADLGLSSDQLEENRGFSFREDAPLDMRMDSGSDKTAAEVVNRYEHSALMRVLNRGGVRRNVKRYVGEIIRNRPIETSRKLAEVISDATPIRDRKDTHPATVVFQAIRIEVNDELREIEILLDTVPDLAAPGGRFACITFHSIEDQLVTKRMRKWQGKAGPAGWPGGGALSEASLGKLLTRDAITPSATEISENPRARSAGLRIFEFD